MIQAHTTRQGKVIYTLALQDLGDTAASGARLRAFCPIHGGDHQHSLSIDTASGWGFCHCCHATVKLQTAGLADHDQSADTCPPSRSCAVQPPASARPFHRECAAVEPANWQGEEVAALRALVPQLCATLASSPGVRAYLEERCIPLALAEASGIGYLSRSTSERISLPTNQRESSERWIGRLIFPLHSSDGPGFSGRTLLKWEPGMDENVHKALLDQPGAPRRWIKTCPAGWFGFAGPARLSEQVILVEGGFDRLALLAAGLPAEMVVALVGTAARPFWFARFAPRVRRIILALDADNGGVCATARLAPSFCEAGLDVAHCSPPQDAWGKDWSERLRKLGPQCVWPLYAELRSGASTMLERRR